MSRYAAIPQIAALSPVHCDITRFHLWSPIATGNHLGRPEIIPNFSQTTGNFDVFDPNSGDSGPLRGELPHVHVFVTDGPKSHTRDAQFFSY